MYGNTVIPTVTLAIGGNGCKVACVSHSTRTAHGVYPLLQLPCCYKALNQLNYVDKEADGD